MDRKARPEGFNPVPRRSEFSHMVGPYLLSMEARQEGEPRLWLGLEVEKKHGGSPGIGHGGMLLWLLDEVMGHGASRASQALCVTVSLQTHFCATYETGDFLRATSEVSRAGSRLVFVEGRILAGDTLIATGSGVWMNTGRPIPGSQD